MGRMLVILLVLCVIVGVVYYAVKDKSPSTAQNEAAQSGQKSDVPQVQEKYGFAPIEE